MPLPTTWRMLGSAAVLGAFVWLSAQRNAGPPIRFTHRPIGFTLDSCETPERHAPEGVEAEAGVVDPEGFSRRAKEMLVDVAVVPALAAPVLTEKTKRSGSFVQRWRRSSARCLCLPENPSEPGAD